tara:strand:+ start:165 stop:563 length:399 start_codon:yes stop_codon:yes gene_type:complete
MNKKYFAKIIAKDPQGLQMISAYCSESRVKIHEIKYLKQNKIFLLSIQRLSREIDDSKDKINSILKFDYISSSKSKNIDQNNPDLIIELLAINLFKKDHNYEITLLFSNNAFITLSAEIIEATLEDQKKIND